MTLYNKVYNLFHQWLSTTDEDFEEFCNWISNQDAIISQENSSSDSQLKQKLKKLSFFTHYPKKHETLTINNVTEEYPSKKEMWEEWFKKVTGLAFTNPTYTATDGSASISATLTENFQPLSNKNITLTGSDGSSYTATTNSDGIVTFDLIGYGDITYTATYNDFTDTCTVNGLNNRIRIVSVSETAGTVTGGGCSSGTKKYRVVVIINISKTYEPNTTVPITIRYRKRSSSGTYSTIISNTTLSSDALSLSKTFASTSCTSYQNYYAVASGSTVFTCNGNWLFEPATIKK